jgi:glycosyltransferase involved in cell wall biosynthesis
MAASKLALVLPDFGGGGAERVALLLARAWIEQGHEVDLVLQRREGALLDLLPSAVRVVDLEAPRLRQAVRPLAHYLRRERPDAVLISMWPLTVIGVVAHRLARSSSRIVLAEHSSLSRQYKSHVGLRRALLTWSIRLFYPRADARVAVSGRAADDLCKLSGIERNSIEVIYNPVDVGAASAGPDRSLDHFWGRGGARILTVGRLSAEKSHSLLISAFARLRRERPARLAIVGDGPLREETRQAAAAGGVAEEVLLPGFVPDPSPYYRSADLFVLSSAFEGFGLVLVEAMAAGLPIVSTDCESGPREILEGGIHGHLVPCDDVDALADAMRSALDEPGDPTARIARASQFRSEIAAARYLEVMLGGPSRR